MGSIVYRYNKVPQLPGMVRKAGGKGIRAIGNKIVARARQLAPVRTGQLRASINAEAQGETRFVIGASAPYATYVEYGTSKMAAQPYLRPAIEEYAPSLVPTIRHELEQVLGS